ncbi:MAG: GNAT family N-acetyltransferase [Phycisphaerales bacterium JB039]
MTAPGSVQIRPAQEADLPSILAIINREIVHGVAHFGTQPMSLETLAAQFAREAMRYPWLAAIDARSGAMLGFAKAGPWKSRGAYAWTTEIGVYVEAAARGRGVGRALYDTLLPMLRAAGFRTVLAGIALPNDASVRLHEAVGMRPCGVFPKVGYKLGAWRDVGYWALRFGDDEAPTAPTDQ